MSNLIIIPARKNSVRLKNKNILKLHNKTLIEHTITFAKKICPNTHILVSTDSKKIRDISLKNNILCPWLRPNKLSSSKASTDDVVLHALNWYEKKNSLVNFVTILQPTTPFRDIKIYFNCLNKAKKNPNSTIITFKKKTKKIYRLKESKIVLEKVNYLEPNGSIYIISSKKIKKNLKIYSGDIKAKIVVNEKENIDIDYKKDYISASKFKKIK
jgi:CMP-N,N'-diacetyllegionaminic acid synthase